MAPPSKPPGRRQRRNTKPQAPLAAAKPKQPAPRAEWYAQTKQQWKRFWASDASRVIALAVDGAAVQRLFDLYDERERAYRDFTRARFVDGSQGQKVLNPMGRMVISIDEKILALEDRLGFSPASRLKLGLELPDERPPAPPAPPARASSRAKRKDPRLQGDSA